MERDNTPKSMNELLAALADGELDLREHPDALTQIAQDAQAAQRVAYQQQLKQSVGQSMDGPDMRCPADLAAKLRAMSVEGVSQDTAATTQSAGSATPAPATRPYNGPPVIGWIGRWAPAAVAAVLLVAAGVLFSQATAQTPGVNTAAAAFLSVEQIDQFSGRHDLCANQPDQLKNAKNFGDASEFDQLPGKLGNYFKASTDGMKLNLGGIGYDYQLTGACALPGKGAVHIVYRNHENPDRAISVWVIPTRPEHDALAEGQVFSISGGDPMHPVIFWRDGGLLYYLVGDSIEDANQAVQALRPAA